MRGPIAGAIGAPFRALGYAMIRASRWVQRTALGLRVPACRMHEADICRQIFNADEKIRFAERSLAYWTSELARLEVEADKAWRVSAALSAQIDAARGMVPADRGERRGA